VTTLNPKQGHGERHRFKQDFRAQHTELEAVAESLAESLVEACDGCKSSCFFLQRK
jgi:hypothetical protein